MKRFVLAASMAMLGWLVATNSTQAGGCSSRSSYHVVRPVYVTPVVHPRIVVHPPEPIVVHPPQSDIVVHPKPDILVHPPKSDILVHPGKKVLAARPVAARPVVPVAAAPAAIAKGLSLQLKGIRFVDPGNPAMKLGPRFRVTLLNPSAVAINQPFDLVLAAGIDQRLLPALPRSKQRIQAMAPGQPLEVDIRLPLESMAMRYPGEKSPAPFSVLFVVVSGRQDLLGNVQLQQLAAVPRIGLPMVDLSIIRPANNQVPAGASLRLAGEGFGLAPGNIVLELPGLKLNTTILNWSPLGAQIQLPKLALAAPAIGKLLVTRNDGATAAPLLIKLLPPGAAAPVIAAEPAIVPAAAPAALPTGPQQGLAAPVAGPMPALQQGLQRLLGGPAVAAPSPPATQALPGQPQQPLGAAQSAPIQFPFAASGANNAAAAANFGQPTP